MTRDEFTAILDAKGYAYELRDDGGVTVTHGGYVYLHSLTTLPAGTAFNNGGYVNLISLTTLPAGIVFKNSGSVFLRNLTTLPADTVFNNGSNVWLNSLTTLPADTVFNNGSNVWLNSLSGYHTYQGKRHLFMHIDGFTMIITGSRDVDGTTLHRAKFLKGGLVNYLPYCWIAERDGLFAHGATSKEALDDLAFKILDNAQKKEIAAAIVASGEVTLDQWRALTTACTEGTRQHLSSLGIDLNSIDKMLLADALKAMNGTTFGDTFKKHLEAAQ